MPIGDSRNLEAEIEINSSLQVWMNHLELRKNIISKY